MMTSAFASTTSEELREQQQELRAAQTQRQEDLIVLNAQLDYAKRELAELEAASEIDGTDNTVAIAEKEATIARMERGVRAKTFAIKSQEETEKVLAEQQAAAQLRELQTVERDIADATPDADARVGQAAFALMQAIIARETLARRFQIVHTLMSDLHERTGKGVRRNVRAYAAPRYDMDAIVGAALNWARSTGHDVDMETWALTESDGKGERR